MRLLTRKSARTAPFDCDEWHALEPNSSRQAVADGGYAHHVHGSHLIADLGKATEALLTYRIFAPHRMRAHVCTMDGRVAVGATIVQRISLGPVVVEAAVRVMELESGPAHARFTYATLPGHVERGLASFSVGATEHGLSLDIETWSQPGNWLLALGSPMARVLQRRFTEEAITWFRESVS